MIREIQIHSCVCIGESYILVPKSYDVNDKILGNLNWFNGAFLSISFKKIVRWSQLMKSAVGPPVFQN